MPHHVFEPIQQPERTCRFKGCTKGPEGTRAVFLPPRSTPNKLYCCASCRKAAEKPRAYDLAKRRVQVKVARGPRV